MTVVPRAAKIESFNPEPTATACRVRGDNSHAVAVGSGLNIAAESQSKTFLATDETRMKHGHEASKGSRHYQIRVQSVFHPWLKQIRAGRQEIAR
jgi:hypothetical protein